ncbi:MAG: iron (metal) dependent repressor, DtxR family [Planctomycetaceae bacterium]|nr:iron (metal) dependent repressor, DtxR family [Planctomycetaceae bacterium]
MESVKVEDYLKAIYHICAATGTDTAATGEVAERLQVTPGSVTTMLQRLAESGLVKYQSHRGAKLTENGQKVALNVLRRHRLVELFLTKTLGMSWDEIHAEAENLEHAVSERLIDRIDQHLGYPDRDPHGDPIPNGDGSLRSAPGEPLADCNAGASFVLERVLDQTPEFLRYLRDGGLIPGCTASVVQNLPSAGIMTLQAGDHQVSLSRDAAYKLLVRVVD